MMWKVIMILPLALSAGCVTTTNSYCDIASPLYFDDSRTVIWLSENDDDLLRDIIIANETWAALCKTDRN
jgi:hypothetical protein